MVRNRKFFTGCYDSLGWGGFNQNYCQPQVGFLHETNSDAAPCLGKSGTTPADWKPNAGTGLFEAMISQANEQQCGGMLFMLGTNAAKGAGQPVDAFMADTEAIINAAATYDIWAVLLEIPWLDWRKASPDGSKWTSQSAGMIEQYNAAMKRIANGRSIRYCGNGVYAATRDNPDAMLMADGVHLMQLGATTIGHLAAVDWLAQDAAVNSSVPAAVTPAVQPAVEPTAPKTIIRTSQPVHLSMDGDENIITIG